MGKTQMELADVFRLSQADISHIITSFTSKISNILDLGMEDGK